MNQWAQYSGWIRVGDFSWDTKRYSATSLLLGISVGYLQFTRPTDFVSYETFYTWKVSWFKLC